MASIYARGLVLWCRVKDESGKWKRTPTPYRKGDEKKAQRYADAAQAAIDERRAGGVTTGPVTVKVYAEQWLANRRAIFEATSARFEATGTGKVQFRDHATDIGRMNKHVIPHLGALKVADVRLGAMFRDAAVAGLTEQNPAILTKAQLGEDEGNTDGAGRYTREQLELMIGSDDLPEHARVFVALGGLCGLRLGAIAGLRWGDLETNAEPLWRLTTSRTYDGQPTKTGKSNRIPVHPVLAEMLTEWRHGWGRLFGRAPTASDPIVPRPPGKWREAPGSPHTKQTGGDLMDSILATLEIPSAPMKAHALRSTFISMALEDGADDRLIERITHTPGKGRRAFDRYDRADWPQLCAEVAKLRISPRSGGRVLCLSTARSTVAASIEDALSNQWRRRESNPGPKTLRDELLRV